MEPCEWDRNTISHEKSSTTTVRIAVATEESVFRMPHFARIAVIPAKKAEAKAKNNHISKTSGGAALCERRACCYCIIWGVLPRYP